MHRALQAGCGNVADLDTAAETGLAVAAAFNAAITDPLPSPPSSLCSTENRKLSPCFPTGRDASLPLRAPGVLRIRVPIPAALGGFPLGGGAVAQLSIS